MGKLPVLVFSGVLALSAPGFAQQGGDAVNRALEGIGRALQGGQPSDRDREAARGGRESRAYQQTYRDTREDLRSYSDRELRDAAERIDSQWTRLEAVSDAIKEEMEERRRGSGRR